MTDPLLPLSDEDLSSLLDGQADPSVLDRLARDPRPAPRRDELAAAAAAVRGEPVPPLAPSLVDDLVAQALAVGLAPEAGPVEASTDPTAPAPVTPLTPPPAPRGRRTPPAWLVAAAVVVLVAIGLGLIWSGTSDDQPSQDTAAQVDQAPEQDDDVLASTERSVGGEAPEPDTTALGAVPSEDGAGATGGALPSIEGRLGPPLVIGSFDDADALRPVVANAFPTEAATIDGLELPTDAAFQRCAEQMRVQFFLDDPATSYGYALVDGVPSMVYEFETTTDDGETTTMVMAVRADTCDPYFTIQR